MKIDNAKTIRDGMNRIRLIALQLIPEQLSALAMKAIDEAYKYKKYKDRTFNLHDSYGYGIYYKGDPVKIAMVDPSVAKVPDTKGGKGHDIGLSFLDSHKPTSKAWVLVIVAGEFYAEQVDAARDGLQVLSGAYQYTDQEFETVFKKI